MDRGNRKVLTKVQPEEVDWIHLALNRILWEHSHESSASVRSRAVEQLRISFRRRSLLHRHLQ